MAAIGPGSLVKCVNGFEDDDWDTDTTYPVIGRVYRVRGIAPHCPHCGERLVCIYLCEVVNPETDDECWHCRTPEHGEPAFDLGCFIPVRDDALDLFRVVERDAPVDLVEV